VHAAAYTGEGNSDFAGIAGEPPVALTWALIPCCVLRSFWWLVNIPAPIPFLYLLLLLHISPYTFIYLHQQLQKQDITLKNILL
jgi:hypothetical protein